MTGSPTLTGVNIVKTKWQISRIAILVITGILIIYVCVQMMEFDKINWNEQIRIGSICLEQAEKMYLTGFTYLENEQGSSLIDWMAESVLKIIPLGTYVEEKSMLFTDVEDQETYQMILEKQLCLKTK